MTIIKPIFVPPKDNTPAYDMIRSFGRKNWNVVRQYIELYSNEGDIIYDPFGGSGVVSYEGLKLNRKVIYNDINPFQAFIAKQLCTPVDIKTLNKAFEELMTSLNSNEYQFKKHESNDIFTCKLNWFLVTKCKCGNEGTIISIEYEDVLIYKARKDKKTESRDLDDKKKLVLKEIIKQKRIWKDTLINILKNKDAHFNKFPYTIESRLKFLEENNYIKRESNLIRKIKYDCSCSKRSLTKQPDKTDLQKLITINEIIPPFYIPDGELYYKNQKEFITRRKIKEVKELFTRKNLIILSIIRKEILNLKFIQEIKDTLLLCFASILFSTSIMNREGAGAWGAKEYWIPTNITEINPIIGFTTRFEISNYFGKISGILAGKQEINDALNGKIKECKKFQALKNDCNAIFFQKDARNLYFDKKIDYIFTDPSYGDAIQYGELTYMAINWLGMKMPFENEIIINENQGKTKETYAEMLMDAFEKIYLSLKPGGYLTVTFHSREAYIWNSLLYAINCHNFEYVDAIYQPKPKEHSNYIYKQKPGAMSGDIYITFRKNENLTRPNGKISKNQIIEDFIIPEAKKLIISRRGKSVTYDQLVRAITLMLIRKNLLHRKEIAEIDYEKLFDKYFIREKIESGIPKKKKRKKKNKEIDKKARPIEKFIKKVNNNE
ncbi:MAG: DNA methyltransferase [Candidatus Helarchaeota archaeon]